MRRALLLLLPLLAAGCTLTRKPLRQSTTPFEGIDTTAQTEVSRGVIHRGFTADMVQRALGAPPQIRAKARGPALEATWIYPNSAGGSTHVIFAHDRVTDILHVK